DEEAARDDVGATAAVAQGALDAVAFQLLLKRRQELAHVGVAVDVQQQAPDDQRQPRQRHEEEGPEEVPIVGDERPQCLHSGSPQERKGEDRQEDRDRARRTAILSLYRAAQATSREKRRAQRDSVSGSRRRPATENREMPGWRPTGARRGA